MPANLTQQYKEAEARFRTAADHAEKMEALREMLALLPKHKGTEKLHADLKKRLAKLEDEGEHAARGGGRRADPGHVKREGAGQWVLLGPLNAGKSSLLAALTHAHPEVAEYPFTTRAAQPGMMPFEDVQVQLVDTPAVAPGHTPPWLANLAHGADGLLMVLDPTADDLAPAWAELEALWERAHAWPAPRPLPPGASPLTRPRPALVALTRRDLDDQEGTLAALATEVIGAGLPLHRVSTTRGDGLEALRAALWSGLGRIRVHTREPGHKADTGRPFVLPAGATVHDLALLVHRDLAERLRFARLRGAARFDGQQVDRHHVLADRDVVELHA
jgi:ribosome-interacting GTPase 1